MCTDAAYYALATLSAQGESPRVRHVVHRGFARGTNALLTTTDVRAPKAAELHARPAFELAWWIAPARVQVGGRLTQFRIRGYASLVSGSAPSSVLPSQVEWGAERERVWDGLRPQMKETFHGAAPGTPLDDAVAPTRTAAMPER